MVSQAGLPTLETIPTASVIANPDNPRGPNVRERDPAFESLRKSISEFGILVPLVVKRQLDGYLLIDGERRYWAAKSLRLDAVPAYVIQQDISAADIRRRMFQIHMTWRGWSPAQQCKALEPVYAELKSGLDDGDAEAMNKLAREVVRITGTDPRTARNRIQFLRWPEAIKKYVYEDREDAYWSVVEIEDKIVEPAMKNYPEYFETVAPDEVREFLFKKLQSNLVQAAIEVRPAKLIVQTRLSASDKPLALKIFDRLVKDAEYGFVEAREDFIRQFPIAAEEKPKSPTAVMNSMRKLTDSLALCDLDFIRKPRGKTVVELNEFAKALEELASTAHRLLDEIKGAE